MSWTLKYKLAKLRETLQKLNTQYDNFGLVVNC